MTFSQLTSVIKTDPCVQEETSITLISYSGGPVHLFNSTAHTKIRSMEGGSGKNLSMYRLRFCVYQSNVIFY